MRRNKQKLLRGADLADVQVFALTQEQRRFQAASNKAKGSLTDVRNVIESELAQLINGVSFELDMSLCDGKGLDVWLKEAGRLMLSSPLISGDDERIYAAMDFTAAHHLADLCLGGAITKGVDAQDRGQLSATEVRVAGRVLHRTALAIEQLLRRDKTALPAQMLKHPVCPENFAYLPCKVRLLLADEMLSWFIWLPVGLFQPLLTKDAEPTGAKVLKDGQWTAFPVTGRIEMARKRVSLQQLKACLNGEIMPIELLEQVPFKLDKQTLFKGRIAEENGALAFQITQIQE